MRLNKTHPTNIDGQTERPRYNSCPSINSYQITHLRSLISLKHINQLGGSETTGIPRGETVIPSNTEVI